MSLSDVDLQLLQAAIDTDGAPDAAVSAFEDMIKRDFPLSAKQRAWATAVVEGKRYDPEPEYENLVSSGRVPRGKEVPLAPALRNLPKRPPGR